MERGIPPAEWTQKNIAEMKAQIQGLNCMFDWNRELKWAFVARFH